VLGRSAVQVVRRTRPRELVYVRKLPVTVLRPTPAQAEVRYLFAQAVGESRLLTVEQVARLVGGEVVEVNGRRYVRMPDGRVLQKHMAYVAYVLGGYRSPRRGLPRPAWLEELSRVYLPSLPYSVVAEVRAKSLLGGKG
jgi:hypothetical protein